MTNNKVWLYSACCQNTHNGRIYHGAGLLVASSEPEALGMAYNEVRIIRPYNEGWQSPDILIRGVDLDGLRIRLMARVQEVA